MRRCCGGRTYSCAYYERQHALLRTLEICGLDFPEDDDESSCARSTSRQSPSADRMNQLSRFRYCRLCDREMTGSNMSHVSFDKVGLSTYTNYVY